MITIRTIHDATRRVGISFRDFLSSGVSTDVGGMWLYNAEAERIGTECWRLVDDIESGFIVDGSDLSEVVVWLDNGGIIGRHIDDLVYVQENVFNAHFRATSIAAELTEEQKLADLFQTLRPVEDWRTDIDTVVAGDADREAITKAVMMFYDIVPTFHPNADGTLAVRAILRDY